MVDRSINSLAAKCQRGGDQSRILVKNKLSMPEKSGAVLTCQVIIKFVIGHGIEEEDRKHSWLKDVNNFTSQVKKQTKTKQFYYYLARPKFIFLLSRLIGCIWVLACKTRIRWKLCQLTQEIHLATCCSIWTTTWNGWFSGIASSTCRCSLPQCP